MAWATGWLRRVMRVPAAFGRDPLRTMRLIFLAALFVVSATTIGQLASTGQPPAVVGVSLAVLGGLFGLRVVEHRRVDTVPVWLDPIELFGAYTVLASTRNIDALLGTYFCLVLFRAAVGTLARLVPLVIGYCAVWLIAVAVQPQIRFYFGAMISIPIVGLQFYGMRALMLRLQERHRAQSTLLDAVLDRLPFPVVVTDVAGGVVLCNPAANALTGLSAGCPGALSALPVRTADDAPVDLSALAASAASGTGAGGAEVRLVRPDGTTSYLKVETVPLTGEIGTRSGTVVALLDMTAQRRYEDRLHRAAYYDTLTGLPNRAMLWQHFDATVAAGERYCVLLIDLNDFKNVNDTLGHLAGDELLQQVARRLEAAIPAGATVARLGGDEFAVLIRDAGRDGAEATAAAVRRSFDAPFELAHGTVELGGTVGVAAAEPGQPPDPVIAAADSAMYRGKRSSRSQLRTPERQIVWAPI